MKYHDMLLNITNDPSKILDFLSEISDPKWHQEPATVVPGGNLMSGANDDVYHQAEI